ncbi:MAG: hypothetical protein ACREN8_10935 [Candidatus Dormibacteraceae bacterium]
MRRPCFALLLLMGVTVGYILAAWSVSPGFFDGLAPPAPYRWVSPPPQLKSGNQPPLSGHGTAAVGSDGQVDPGTVETQDAQASISFIPGSFQSPADHSSVTLRITPQPHFPDVHGLRLATNTYCFTSTAPLASGRQILITLGYADSIEGPSAIYGYSPGRSWQKVGSTNTSAPFTMSVQVSWLGCFAAGSEPVPPSNGGSFTSGQLLPLLVGGLLLLLLLAALPLILLRRHRSDDEVK